MNCMQNRFERDVPKYERVADWRYIIPGEHPEITEVTVNRGYSLHQKVEVSPAFVKENEGTQNEKVFTVFSIKP